MEKLFAVIMICMMSPFATVYAEGVIPNGKNCIIGMASWYSKTDRGIHKTTANMESFCDRKNTCAVWNMPFNTLVRVTNLLNGKSIIVRVNDRGPAKHLVKRGRIIDLTKGAFSKIAEPGHGLIPIKISALQSG